MRPRYLKQINEKIIAAKQDSVFVPSDFFDIAEPVNVCMCLKRLADGGKLKRIIRGVYAKPGGSPPSTVNVAQAIARNFGWTIAPCGDTALYESKLSYKKPVIWTFVSDGQYQSYAADGIVIKFKHTDNKSELVDVSYQTALYIQALRAIGKDNIKDSIIRKLAKTIKKYEVPKILFGTQRITVWLKGFLKRICEESEKYLSYMRSANRDSYPESRRILTQFGYKVRSKSEALIDASLRLAGIEFIYEKILYDKAGNRFKTDFAVLHDGKEYYWEHLGLLDNKDYAKKWSIKEKWYKKNFPGQLLTTTDQVEVDPDDIGTQINKRIHDILKLSNSGSVAMENTG